jgi:hypothetical protein
LRDHYYSVRYRLLGHCWACHRRVILHTPRQWRVCVVTPPGVQFERKPVAPAA